jgi:hypothetical protein
MLRKTQDQPDFIKFDEAIISRLENKNEAYINLVGTIPKAVQIT